MTALEAPFSALTPRTFAPRRLRSARAVFGGLATTFAATTLVDVVLHSTGVFPTMPERMSGVLFAVALAYRIPLNALGCFVAARLAPSNPARHAYALGFIGVVLATIGAIAMWDCGPAWYSLANIAVALPCAWLGARFARRGTAR